MASDCTLQSGFSAIWNGVEATFSDPTAEAKGGQQQGEFDSPATMWPHLGKAVTYNEKLCDRCVEKQMKGGWSVPW